MNMCIIYVVNIFIKLKEGNYLECGKVYYLCYMSNVK